MTDEEIPPGGPEVSDPRRDSWQPADVARRLAGVTVPWYVAGWLQQALRRVHPGHAWIGALGRDSTDGGPP